MQGPLSFIIVGALIGGFVFAVVWYATTPTTPTTPKREFSLLRVTNIDVLPPELGKPIEVKIYFQNDNQFLETKEINRVWFETDAPYRDPNKELEYEEQKWSEIIGIDPASILKRIMPQQPSTFLLGKVAL
jgi:hypothetical protein